MLLKTTHLATSLAPFTYLKRCPYSFSKATQSPITPAIINPNLLYRVSQEQTLRALEFTMEQNNFLYKLDPKDLIVFDKISETLDSKTHRVFDLYQKKFFAVKTLSLESETAWKHLNIALRRYHEGSTPLATIRSFDYDKSAKKVHIVSDIGRTIVSDYATFKKQNDIPWTKLELRALTWQLIAQMYAFKKIGVECNYLKPEHMFVSHDGKSIELYDYPGFELESKLVHRLRTRLDMNIVLMTLVHIIDPGAPVGCVSEAKSYLKTYFPEFLSEFERMKFDLNVSAFLTGDLTKKIKHEVYKSIPIENVILDRRYELHNTERLKKILESKDLPRFEENRGLIAQGLFQTREAISIFENMREKSNKYGQTQEDSARAHLHLGEIYQNTNPDKALEHFSKAASISCCLPQMDNALKARIFNEYGKTLWDKDQTKEALYCFKEVQKILRNATDVPSRLREEIKANLSYFEKNCEPDGVSCEVNEFSLGVKLYFLFMGIAIVNFGFWAYWNRNPEPEVNKTSPPAEKNPKPTRKISEVSKKVAPKPNTDNQAQQKEKDQALIAQEKRQKRINWALFGLSLMVSTAMIGI